MMGDLAGPVQHAKHGLLGEMGAGKTSQLLRYVKGQFFDYQVGATNFAVCCLLGPGARGSAGMHPDDR